MGGIFLKAFLYIFIAAILWGFAGSAVRPLAEFGLTALDMTFVRSLAVFAGVGILILITDSRRLTVRLHDIWIFAGAGIFSIVCFNICYFITQQIFPLSLSVIFLYTAPCFVTVLSAVFFKEPVTLPKLAALFLAFSGCILSGGGVGLSGVRLTLGGVAVGICSGFGYSLYTLFGKAASARYHTFTFMMYTFFTAALFLTPFANMRAIAECCMSEKYRVYLIMFMIVFTLIPYLLYTAGLSVIGAGRASVIAFAEPMVATAAGLLIYGEKPTLMTVTGLALIFISVVFSALAAKSEISETKKSYPKERAKP